MVTVGKEALSEEEFEKMLSILDPEKVEDIP